MCFTKSWDEVNSYLHLTFLNTWPNILDMIYWNITNIYWTPKETSHKWKYQTALFWNIAILIIRV